VSTTTPTPIAPPPRIPGPPPHPTPRHAAVVAGVAALIAAGGYAAVTILGPDAQPPRSVPAQRSAPPTVSREQAVREARDSIATLYGPRRSADIGAGSAPTPRDVAMKEMRESIVKLYGPRRSAGAAATPSDDPIEQMRDSIARLYGNPQSTGRIPTEKS